MLLIRYQLNQIFKKKNKLDTKRNIPSPNNKKNKIKFI